MILIDVDGCISDDRWRLSLVDYSAEDPWHAYHLAAEHDEPANLHVLTEPAIALTAMPARYAAIRRSWLRRHAPAVVHVVMRPDDDLSESPILKHNMLRFVRSRFPSEPIRAAYDDRADVVSMYRRAGIHAEVLAV